MSAGKVSSYIKKIEAATTRKASKQTKRQFIKEMMKDYKEYNV